MDPQDPYTDYSWSRWDSAAVIVPHALRAMSLTVGMYVLAVFVLFEIETYVFPGTVSARQWVLIAVSGPAILIALVTFVALLTILSNAPTRE